MRVAPFSLLICILFAAPLLPPAARASTDATIFVTTTNDELDNDGQCSLREAVQAANTDRVVSGCAAGTAVDSIQLPAGTYLLDLPNAGGLHLNAHTSLIGSGADTTIIDAGGSDRTALSTSYQELLTCDSGDNTIKRYSTSGAYVSQLVKAAANGGLSLPNRAEPNYDDSLLYVSSFSTGIKRYRLPSGTYSDTLIAPSGAYGTYNSLAASDFVFLLGTNDLLVADYYPPASPTSPGRILRFNSFTGAFVSEFIAPGSGDLKNPNSLALYGSHLYVTDASGNTVLRFNKTSGAFVDAFVSAGSGGLNRPRGLAFRGASLYVASELTDQVLKYNASTGAFQSAFVAAGSGGLDRPQALTFGPDGNLYVSSNATKQVLRYNGETGAFIDVFVDADEGVNGTAGCPIFVQGVGSGPIVNVRDVTIRNSVAAGIATGHGIFNGPRVTLQVSRSIIRDNVSNSPGAGIANGGYLVLNESTVTANRTLTGTFGGTQYSGGGIMNYANSTAKINNSTVSNNIAVRGGGLRNAGGHVEIVNSTISGNHAQARGGGLMNFGTMWIAFSTITDNEANIVDWSSSGSEPMFGGGLYNEGRVSVGNSIVAGNTDNRSRFESGFAPDCWSTQPDDHNLTSFRGNVIGVLNPLCPLKDSTWGDTRFDQTGSGEMPLNPRLSALANNGGTTRTHAPLSNSPAVEHGDGVTSATFFDCPARDQRGAPRPAGEKCDAGAHEYGASALIHSAFVPLAARP